MAAGTEDPFDLQRFVDAQRGIYDRVRDELEAGRKRSHWVWFIFPQIEGLGSSMMARRYAITGVPTIIVNGKFSTSATLAGSDEKGLDEKELNEKTLKVVDYLVAQERAAGKPDPAAAESP